MLKIFSRNTDHLSDQDLVDRFTNSGNLKVLGDLYNRYIELQYGLCFKYLKDRSLAEDAVMSIFEELIEKLPKYKVENFRSWLYTLSKNHCLMVLRTHQKQLKSPIEEENFMHSEEESHLIDKELKEEEFLLMEACIEMLPNLQKTCIKYHYYDKKSYLEIAEILGKEKDKVRSYIQNGRRNIKNCMKKKSEKIS